MRNKRRLASIEIGFEYWSELRVFDGINLAGHPLTKLFQEPVSVLKSSIATLRQGWKWYTLVGALTGPLLKIADLLTSHKWVAIESGTSSNFFTNFCNTCALVGEMALVTIIQTLLLGLLVMVWVVIPFRRIKGNEILGWIWDVLFTIVGLFALFLLAETLAKDSVMIGRGSLILGLCLISLRWVPQFAKRCGPESANPFQTKVLWAMALLSSLLTSAVEAKPPLDIFTPVSDFGLGRWACVLMGSILYAFALYYFYKYIERKNPFTDEKIEASALSQSDQLQ